MRLDSDRTLLRRKAAGFTLIELLLVVAVILVLAGITFGISRGVRNAQARAQAKAELAVIAQALESYKSTHGDYPWTTNGDVSSATQHGERLFDALIGWTTFERTGNVTTMNELESADVPSNGPKSFLDPSKLSYSGSDLPDSPNTPPSRDNYFTDPWGIPYVYVYGKSSTANSWEIFGYHLYSRGADGDHDTASINASTGVQDSDYRDQDENIDNIYSGE